MSRVVIVPDPDNERGSVAVDHDTGKFLARGYLEVEVPALFTAPSDTPRRAAVMFVEHPAAD